MHSAVGGYWHNDFTHAEYYTPLKDNMLFVRGGQCLITTVPDGFYPLNGALGMHEIVGVLTEQDFQEQYSVLLDQGEMTPAEMTSLAPPILDGCQPNHARMGGIRRVTEAKLTVDQAATLEDGGVVLLPEYSNSTCMKALIPKSARNSWYWPNSDTGAKVALQKIIYDVAELFLCDNFL